MWSDDKQMSTHEEKGRGLPSREAEPDLIIDSLAKDAEGN